MKFFGSRIIVGFAVAAAVSSTFAGGLNTNTNQSVIFQRSVARDASTDVDAPYANPAGTAFMADGWHIALDNQVFFQSRSIKMSNSPLFKDGTKFEGKTFVPAMPSLLLTWHHGNLALFTHLGVIGGGGTAEFNDGIPSFEASVAQLPASLTAAGLPTSAYKADISLDAQSYVFGATLGASYKFADMFSLSLGARFNYAISHYEGSLKYVQINPTMEQFALKGDMVEAAVTFEQMSAAFAGFAKEAAAAADQYGKAGMKEKAAEYEAMAAAYTEKSYTFAGLAQAVSDKELEVDQNGWGITPILGLGFKYKRLTVGAKLEYNTSIEMKNDTKKNEVGLAAYNDGVKDHNDIPTLVSLGLSYAVLDNARLNIGYHHWFDSKANFAGDLEDQVDDTNELLFGFELDVTKRWTISSGIQITHFGLSDEYLSDMNINLSATSVGLGVAYTPVDFMRINLGYFHALYNEWEEKEAYGLSTYGRTSKGFGLGLEFHL